MALGSKATRVVLRGTPDGSSEPLRIRDSIAQLNAARDWMILPSLFSNDVGVTDGYCCKT